MGLTAQQPVYKPGDTVQEVFTEHTGKITDNVHIPDDDTIPQITEGTLALTRTITPRFATSLLEIDIVAHIVADAGLVKCVALFQDAGVDAIGVGCGGVKVAGRFSNIKFSKKVDPIGSTTLKTYTVRFGSDGGDSYLNGTAVTRYYGGRLISSVTIREIKQ